MFFHSNKVGLALSKLPLTGYTICPMAEALYRIYRPQTFADVVNQQHVRITLQHALEQDRVAHAYLFAGPRGVGKTTIARILARAVNCLKPKKDGEPCNACPTCTAILTNSCLDIIEIDAASQTGVDNVRENIIQSARAIPAMSKKKVFIIDEVHMLSTSAFNALLKLLEEPPAHAMFILATTEAHRIPETIISRTQRFDFKKIGVDDIVQRLQLLAAQEHRQVDDDVAKRIARHAGGSVRDAETMLGQLFSFEEKRITNVIADLVLPRSDQQLILQLLEHCFARQTIDAITIFHGFCEEGGDVPTLVHDFILTARGVLLCAVDPRLVQQVNAEFDPGDTKRLIELSTTVSVADVNRLIELFLTAERRLSKAVMVELPVELAIISFTNIAGSGMATVLSSTTTSPSKPATQAMPPPTPPKTADEKKAPAAKKKSGGQLTLQIVRDAWQAIQRTIGHSYPSIGLSVQHAVIGDVSDEEVILHVPFKLHADRLSDPKYSGPLKAALDEALGQSVRLSIMVTGDPLTVLPAKAEPLNVQAPVTPSTPTASSSGPAKVKGDLWDQVVAGFAEV